MSLNDGPVIGRLRPPPPPQMSFGQPPPAVTPSVTSLRRLTLAADLVLPAHEFAGKHMAFLGMSGSGKSTSTRRFLEQALAAGFPVSVADIENEYAGLKEIADVIVAGPQGDYGRIPLDIVLSNEKQCYTLGKKAYLEGRSVVLLLQELDDDVRKSFLRAYCDGMFNSANNPDTRRNHIIVFEECQEYIPQTGLSKDDPLRQTLLRLAKRGRKRGISMVLVSQRPANVDKDAITQCQIFVAHQVVYPTDIATYKNILTFDNIDRRLGSMQPGDVWFQYGKTLVETRFMLPQTASPSETPGAIDPSHFKSVENVEVFRTEIDNTEVLGGVSVVDSLRLFELEASEKQVGFLKAAIDTAIIRQGELEAQILRLREKPSTGNSSHSVSDRSAEVYELTLRVADEKARADKAEAFALPIKLMLGMLEQHR